jgi:hypothetical protein
MDHASDVVTQPQFDCAVLSDISLPPPIVNNPYGSDVQAAVAIGSEEEDISDVDDMENEFTQSNDVDSTESGIPGVSHSLMPTWLKDEFHYIQDHLVDEMKKNSSHMPRCYERHSLYEHDGSPYLKACASYDGSAASMFHQAHYFVWLPHLLVHQIPCPACKVAQWVSAMAPAVYLQKHGFVDSPHHVVVLLISRKISLSLATDTDVDIRIASSHFKAGASPSWMFSLMLSQTNLPSGSLSAVI